MVSCIISIHFLSFNNIPHKIHWSRVMGRKAVIPLLILSLFLTCNLRLMYEFYTMKLTLKIKLLITKNYTLLLPAMKEANTVFNTIFDVAWHQKIFKKFKIASPNLSSAQTHC